jgi:hypothetical protein
MRYLRVYWSHSSPSEPDETLVELDEQGREARVIEFCQTRILGFASRAEEMLPTGLIQVPWTPLEEVGVDADYSVRTINEAQFEAAWEDRWRLAPGS